MKMGEFPKLSKTPIKEIVVTVAFDGEITEEHLNHFREKKDVKASFKNAEKMIDFSVSFSPFKEGDVTHEEGGFSGLVLRDKKENPHRILNVRMGSFSYHIVDKYVSFEKIIADLKQYWNELTNCCGKLTETSLQVRYLNFIPIAEKEDYSQYLNVQAQHGFGKTQSGLVKIKFEKNNFPITLTVSKGKLNNRFGAVVDYSIIKNLTETNTELFENLNKIRTIKNWVFFNSISEKTINKFA
jgi:uncharacterized protein (TIGR04255 family)